MNAGGNNEGQLGLETRKSVFQPFVPPAMGDFLPFIDLGTGVTPTAITIGSGCCDGRNDFSCALLSNGQLKCWGGSRIICSLPYPRCQGVSVAWLNYFALFELSRRDSVFEGALEISHIFEKLWPGHAVACRRPFERTWSGRSATA